jgi:hypothetical protein
MSNKYGQNGGDNNASSDRPGEHTTSRFLPQADLVAAKSANVQNREIDSTQYKTTFGMRDRNPDSRDAKIPGTLIPNESEPVRQPGYTSSKE